jgi:hypothetical protein
MKPKLVDSVERVGSLDINRVEIVIDDTTLDKVEIYMLDQLGNRVEGGTFDKSEFMNAVLAFYNAHF